MGLPGLPEFRGYAPALNIKSPATMSCVIYIIQTGDKKFASGDYISPVGRQKATWGFFCLGVTMSPDLTWYTHINTILEQKQIACLHFCSSIVLSFTTDHWELPRSYLKDHVLAPRMKGSITKTESLQRRATKFILNMHWQEDISYLTIISAFLASICCR